MSDAWAAYQFDAAVVAFGNAIESAVQEQVKTGSDDKPTWSNKYTLTQLLTPGFIIGDGDEGDELPIGVDGIAYDEV